MGFASGADMFRATAKNRKPNKQRRTFGEISEAYSEKHVFVDRNKLTSAQFERFKIELKEKRRREFYRKILLIFAIMVAVSTVFILILR